MNFNDKEFATEKGAGPGFSAAARLRFALGQARRINRTNAASSDVEKSKIRPSYKITTTTKGGEREKGRR